MKNFYTPIGKFLASKGGGALVKEFNILHAKPKTYDMNSEEDRKEFNEIYQSLIMSDMGKIIRTPSGGISKCKENRKSVWDLREYQTVAILTAIVEGYTFCYKIKTKDKINKRDLTGCDAFQIFKYKCLEYGIDLDTYQIENGPEVKATIPCPKISMKYIMTKDDEGIPNCHHIDFHNSYPAGLCNTHPEFRQVIEPIYKDRKKNPENKAILNYTIGFMQSLQSKVGARWAHLSKDAITDNNNRIDALTAKLESSGREILGYNTDGIWYTGEIYHGEGEGKNLGEWENDHTNCLFRSKSNGAYEFIEDGKYYPVVRGKTRLDEVSPRESWHWGDIYSTGSIIKYKLIPFVGVKPLEVDDEN